MKLSFKKTLALLLSVLMIVGCMSITALADDVVAKIGDAEYTSLAAALEAAQNGDKIVLQKNYTLPATLYINKSIELNLNAFTLSGVCQKVNNVTTKTRIEIAPNVDVTLCGVESGWTYGTIKNAATIAEAPAPGYEPGVALIKNEGNLTLSKIDVESDDTCIWAKDGTVSVDYSVTITSKYGNAIATNGTAGNAELDSNSTVVNISGGTIKSTYGVAVYVPAGTFNITGGNITGATGVYMKGGRLNISGSIITGNGPQVAYTYYGSGAVPTGDAFVVDVCGYPYGANPAITVTGGTFKSTNAAAVGSYAKDANFTAKTGFLSGGEFYTAVPATLVAQDFHVVENYSAYNGTFYTIKSGATAVDNWKVGDNYYEEFSAAVYHAGNNGTVEQNADITNYLIYSAGEPVTINLSRNISYSGSYTLNLKNTYGSSAAITITGTGTVTNTAASNYSAALDCDGNVIVKGGTFVQTDSTKGNALYVTGGPVTIEGGTFEGNLRVGDYAGDNALTIKGGTFTVDPSEYVATGYAVYPLAGGKYKVEVEGNAEAKIGDVAYLTFKDAVEAANDGDTITILRSFTTDASKTTAADRTVITVPVTIDFGEYTMSVPGELEPTDNWAALYVDADTTITATTGGIDCLDNVADCGVYAIVVENEATLNINGGSYHGGGTIVQSTKGTAIITAGYFSLTPYSDPKYGSKFAMNCIDAAHNNGTASISVSGGTFVGFDPTDVKSEPTSPISIVASGYNAAKVLNTWVVGKITDDSNATSVQPAVQVVEATYTDDQGEEHDVTATVATSGTATVTEAKIEGAATQYSLEKAGTPVAITVTVADDVIEGNVASAIAQAATVINDGDTVTVEVVVENKTGASGVPSEISAQIGAEQKLFNIDLAVVTNKGLAGEATHVVNAVAGTYTVKIPVGTPLDSGKQATIRHFNDNGTVDQTYIVDIDEDGYATITVPHFSYIGTEIADTSVVAYYTDSTSTVRTYDDLASAVAGALGTTYPIGADNTVYLIKMPRANDVTGVPDAIVLSSGQSIKVNYADPSYIANIVATANGDGWIEPSYDPTHSTNTYTFVANTYALVANTFTVDGDADGFLKSYDGTHDTAAQAVAIPVSITGGSYYGAVITLPDYGTAAFTPDAGLPAGVAYSVDNTNHTITLSYGSLIPAGPIGTITYTAGANTTYDAATKNIAITATINPDFERVQFVDATTANATAAVPVAYVVTLVSDPAAAAATLAVAGVTGDPIYVVAGHSVHINVTANDGYTFEKFTKDTAAGTDWVNDSNMPAEKLTVVANFVSVYQVTVIGSYSDGGAGYLDVTKTVYTVKAGPLNAAGAVTAIDGTPVAPATTLDVATLEALLTNASWFDAANAKWKVDTTEYTAAALLPATVDSPVVLAADTTIQYVVKAQYAVTQSADPNETTTGAVYAKDDGSAYVAAVTGYADKYDYTVVVTVTPQAPAVAYDLDPALTVDGSGNITIPAATISGLTPGSSIAITVTKAIKPVTVEAYTYLNNLVLVTARSASNVPLKYFNATLYTDPAFDYDDGNTVYVMLVDVAAAGLTGKTLVQIEDAIKVNIEEAAPEVTLASKLQAAGKNDVNLTNTLDVADVNLVYGAYMGTYTYQTDSKGVVRFHDVQHLLSDVTYRALADAAAATAALNDAVAQVTIEDVHAEYVAVYPAATVTGP